MITRSNAINQSKPKPSTPNKLSHATNFGSSLITLLPFLSVPLSLTKREATRHYGRHVANRCSPLFRPTESSLVVSFVYNASRTYVFVRLAHALHVAAHVFPNFSHRFFPLHDSTSATVQTVLSTTFQPKSRCTPPQSVFPVPL